MTIERDMTAALPGPLNGAAWAAGWRRNAYGGESAIDRRTLAEITDLPTVARRAGQAAAMLRSVAEDGRAPAPRWLAIQAAIYRGRAQWAADEDAHHRERDGKHRSGRAWTWAQIAGAYAWAAAHIEEAAAAPVEDARAWMQAAADRLTCLTLAIPHQ
ncbi:hypothetical protein [Streptomyces sp. NPDC002067]